MKGAGAGAATCAGSLKVAPEVYEQTPETPIGSVHDAHSAPDAQPGMPFR